MKVLSLFDGMSCGRIALERAGLKVDAYYASEIDEGAIAISRKNYPDIIQLGSVENWEDWDIDWESIDLVIGGSPCQGFSSAGSQKAFNDPRSRLFWIFADVVDHVKLHNPNSHFLLENVRMKDEWADIITHRLGVPYVHINSSLVSAQSRQRMYWADWDFRPPADRGITMEDIIDGPFYSTRDKSYCIDANYGKGTNFRRYFYMASRQLVLENGYDPRDGMTKENANDIMHRDGNRWRKLSPEECERLQTVPVGYTAGVAAGARYHALGNGWTVDVIAHIFSNIKDFMIEVEPLAA